MLALIAVLAGLGGYIYFVDAKRPASAIAEKEKVFADLTADKIEEISVTSDGESSTLRKADGAWKMTAPIAADADQNEISTLTSNLSSLEINRVIDEKLNDGQLSESPLTLAEMTLIRSAFLDSLVGHYHQRIAYPNFPGS